jgi:hypothetical protein
MSYEESSAIEALRQTIRWLIGGVLGLLAGALPWAECHEYDRDTPASFPAAWLAQNGLEPYTPVIAP